MYAQILIVSNITKGQMVHVARLNTASEIWTSLRAIHETKDYGSAIAIQRGLFELRAKEGSDIAEHLTQLKQQWERLNVLDSPSFHIPDLQFKTLIASSLPSSWDVFTEPYMGGRIDAIETDPKKLMSSQEFIGAIKEEYLRRKSRVGNTAPDQTYYTKTFSKNRPLADRIHNSNKPTETTQSSSSGCRNCGFRGHTTDNCRWLGQQKCEKCGWFGTEGHDCQRILKRKAEKLEKKRSAKKGKREQVNQVVEDDEEAIVFTAEEMAGACNFDTYNSLDIEGNDERLLYYDWLADSATTSHVTNMRDAFTTFQPLDKHVSGVGNAITQAKGKGTIKLQTHMNGKQFHLLLEDVLYIPSNPQNLISLGRWDKAGGSYHGGNGQLVMNRKDGQTVATGTRIKNHLYKINNITTQTSKFSTEKQAEHQTFAAASPVQDWEVWHRQFGHISLDSLRTCSTRNLLMAYQ
jgi:hypothetical protein